MKNILIFISLFSLVFPKLNGQYDLDGNYDLNFDNEYGLNHLFIDTIADPDNIWQVGVPQKGLFTSAKSLPNVIVTDAINSYPVNDTSSFLIMNVANYGFVTQHTVILEGQYFVDSDTLKDYGKIEFSPDNGIIWLDLFNDSIPVSEWYWYCNMPVLTGNSHGWKSFGLNLAPLGAIFDISLADTVQYRFTFISDGIDNNKAGLMFDDLHFEDYDEYGIQEQGFSVIKSSCYPNPTRNQLTIEFVNTNNSVFELELFDLCGGKILFISNITGEKVSFETSNLYSGLFYYRLSDKNLNKITAGRFIKHK